jgi:hypothetical protein
MADTWGVPTALQTLMVMPIMGFLLCLFLPAASFIVTDLHQDK